MKLTLALTLLALTATTLQAQTHGAGSKGGEFTLSPQQASHFARLALRCVGQSRALSVEIVDNLQSVERCQIIVTGHIQKGWRRVRRHGRNGQRSGPIVVQSIDDNKRIERCDASIDIHVAKEVIPGAGIARYVPSVDRARRLLGLSETVDLQDAIRRTAAWYVEEGKGGV